MDIAANLDTYVLQPPIPALLTVAIAAGVCRLASKVSRQITGTRSAFAGACTYILILGSLASLIQIAALAGTISKSGLQITGSLLVVIGVTSLFSVRPQRILACFREWWRDTAWIDRLALGTCGLSLAALLATALGPVTDADSLHYHLAVPIDWLANGVAYPREDWTHMRLVGLGEFLNMLGLATGTDSLGAVLQWSGLIVAIVALWSIASTNRDKIFALLAVSACPAVLFLVPTQKPQLLASCALVLGMVAVYKAGNNLNATALTWTFGLAAFAAAYKLSFLISAAALTVYALYRAYTLRVLRRALMVCTICYLVFLGPGMYRNLVWYGDPFTPALENLRQAPDPYALDFKYYLRQAGYSLDPDKLLYIPLYLLVPTRESLSGPIGCGLLAIAIAIGYRRYRPKGLMPISASIIVICTILAIGQIASRYLFEAYLWSIALVLFVPFVWPKKIVYYILVGQSSYVCALAILFAIFLFPGALTATARSRVMSISAHGYAEAVWLNKVVPKGAVIAAELRSVAVLPRPFVILKRKYLEPFDKEQAEHFWTQIMNEKVTVAVMYYPIQDEQLASRIQKCGWLLASPQSFTMATRNPYNRQGTYQVAAYGIKPQCTWETADRRRVSVTH